MPVRGCNFAPEATQQNKQPQQATPLVILYNQNFTTSTPANSSGTTATSTGYYAISEERFMKLLQTSSGVLQPPSMTSNNNPLLSSKPSSATSPMLRREEMQNNPFGIQCITRLAAALCQCRPQDVVLRRAGCDGVTTTRTANDPATAATARDEVLHNVGFIPLKGPLMAIITTTAAPLEIEVMVASSVPVFTSDPAEELSSCRGPHSKSHACCNALDALSLQLWNSRKECDHWLDACNRTSRGSVSLSIDRKKVLCFLREKERLITAALNLLFHLHEQQHPSQSATASHSEELLKPVSCIAAFLSKRESTPKGGSPRVDKRSGN